jgi:hypothetical protein
MRKLNKPVPPAFLQAALSLLRLFSKNSKMGEDKRRKL